MTTIAVLTTTSSSLLLLKKQSIEIETLSSSLLSTVLAVY
jgi:hypothetical protein